MYNLLQECAIQWTNTWLVSLMVARRTLVCCIARRITCNARVYGLHCTAACMAHAPLQNQLSVWRCSPFRRDNQPAEICRLCAQRTQTTAQCHSLASKVALTASGSMEMPPSLSQRIESPPSSTSSLQREARLTLLG